MTVHIHIERLVLDGMTMTAGESQRLQTAVQHELGRLVAIDGLDLGMKSGGAVPRTQGTHFNPPNGASTKVLGRHIAQSVHGGIGRSK
jgi:hypothetical protein